MFGILPGSGAVTWSSKLQTTVATSTAEAETNAAAAAAQEAVHLSRVLGFLGWEVGFPVVIKVDNQACMAIARNPVQPSKTKHFEIKLFYLRDVVADETVRLEYVSTEDNAADILTKGLLKQKTLKFCNFILGRSA